MLNEKFNALDKKEPMKDVAGYMNNWVDGMVVRHENDLLQEEFAQNIKSFYINWSYVKISLSMMRR